MALQNAKRDQNHIPAISGVTDDANLFPPTLKVDPVTDRLKVNTTVTGFVDSLIKDAGGAVATVEARKQTPTGNALNVQIGPGDVISSIPIVMDYPHHQIHEGETYMYHWYGAVNTTSKDIRISVPALTATTRTPHVLVEIIADAGALLYLYESTTFTSGGTEITTIYNRNRNSTNAPQTKLYGAGGTALTVNALGTELWQGLLISGAKASNTTERSLDEWDLKTSTEYLLRVTTSGNANVLIRLNWYEDLGV